MTYIVYPPQISQRSAPPSFDSHQFENHGRFLRSSGLDYNQLHNRMHVKRIADLRRGRKAETPAWVLSDEEFREVLVLYLESRFQIHQPTGSLKQRLERCKAVGKERARGAKSILVTRVAEFRATEPAIAEERFSELPEDAYFPLFLGALRGRSPADRLQRLNLQISCIDSEAAMSERAPELVTACAYYFYRLGWNSCSIAEELNLRSVHVRQIICRLNRAARRRAQGTPMKLGRPRSKKPCSFSEQTPGKKAA
jgi:hypothetical protein